MPKRKASPRRCGSYPSFLFLPQHPLSSGSTHYLYHLPFSLLPSCPFIPFFSFLSPFPLAASPFPTHLPLSSILPHPYPSPKSSDAELGLKKSHFTELMALWELLFEYYLIQLRTEKVSPNHAWWFMTGHLINKVILELSFGKGKWLSRGCCELTSLPEALRLSHTLRRPQVVQNDQYQGHIWETGQGWKYRSR